MTQQPVSSEILDRMPPVNLDAEKGVLGSLLLDANRCDEVALIIQADDFYADANKKLFKHLMAMHEEGKRIDALLLKEWLTREGDFEAIGGLAYLAEVIQSVPYAANAIYYANIVRDKSLLRSLLHAGVDMIREAHTSTEAPAEILDRAEAALAALRADKHGNQPKAVAEAVVDAITRIDTIHERQQAAGYLTGLHLFDEHIGGLFPSELFVLAGRPGDGKTSLACQISYHFAARGRRVYFVSLEMSAVELATRVLCTRAEVSSKSIRTGQLTATDLSRLTSASQSFAQIMWLIDDRPRITTTDIRRSARRIHKDGLSLIVVDYLQRLTPTDRRVQRHEQVGQMSDALKALARELDVPVLCLTQLNRQTETEKGPPRLGHLRESGAIEQDADVVGFLYPVAEKPSDPTEPVPVDLVIRKNRNGETGEIHLEWIPAWTLFRCREAFG